MEQKTNREVINKPPNETESLEADPKPSCMSEKTPLGWVLDEAPGMSICKSGAVICNAPVLLRHKGFV